MGAGSSTDSLNNTGLQTRWMSWAEVARCAKQGDLIEFSRSFSIGYASVPYKHWAVFSDYMDREPYVIHYSNPGNRTSSNDERLSAGWIPESLRQNGASNELFDSYIRKDKLRDIAVSSKCRINNNQDYLNPPFRPAEILRRAISRMGHRGYNLYSSNCEHFARWARNGTWESHQISLLHGGSSMALDGPDSMLGRLFPSVHSALDYERPHPHVDYRKKNQEEGPGFFGTILNVVMIILKVFLALIIFLILFGR